mmetsp:Transcript_9965/g.22706  ORF Transcript_9965/g.22706 Transcript_9965/m.22706 type:complete len:132 (+) Transcript_9965:869-1264(+)
MKLPTASPSWLIWDGRAVLETKLATRVHRAGNARNAPTPDASAGRRTRTSVRSSTRKRERRRRKLSSPLLTSDEVDCNSVVLEGLVFTCSREEPPRRLIIRLGVNTPAPRRLGNNGELIRAAGLGPERTDV